VKRTLTPGADAVPSPAEKLARVNRYSGDIEGGTEKVGDDVGVESVNPGLHAVVSMQVRLRKTSRAYRFARWHCDCSLRDGGRGDPCTRWPDFASVVVEEGRCGAGTLKISKRKSDEPSR
jgi:hypothetical protein